MKLARLAPPFDHGAALRVPPPHDKKSWAKLWMWLGDEACALDDRGAVQVSTPEGAAIARPGDWIVLSSKGAFFVAHARRDWE